MAAKKSTVEKLTGAVQDAASAVAKAATEHVVKPVGKALGLTDEPKESGKQQAGGEEVGPKATPVTAAPEPTPSDKRTTGKKTQTARMMTKPVAVQSRTTAARTMSRPVGDEAKPRKGRGHTGAKGPRRGASKGR
jgi:hypothetical protein